jgi:DNA-binding transcriptional MerR regulator
VLEVKPQPVPGPARSGTQAGLSIAEAARRTGVSVHTLRYYERAGLVVTTVGRTQGGRRRYQQEDLTWIAVCTKLRATGMPIKTIRRYAQLVAAGPGNEQERLALRRPRRAGTGRPDRVGHRWLPAAADSHCDCRSPRRRTMARCRRPGAR